VHLLSITVPPVMNMHAHTYVLTRHAQKCTHTRMPISETHTCVHGISITNLEDTGDCDCCKTKLLWSLRCLLSSSRSAEGFCTATPLPSSISLMYLRTRPRVLIPQFGGFQREGMRVAGCRHTPHSANARCLCGYRYVRVSWFCARVCTG
jgi:hypothetical protein